MSRQECDYYDTSTVVLEFDVTNLSISYAWGSSYYNTLTYNTGINLTNKKIFVSFKKSTSYDAIAFVAGISGNNLVVNFLRCTTATISGKLAVMICD